MQLLQREIQRPHRIGLPGPLADPLVDRYTLRLVTQAPDGNQNGLFQPGNNLHKLFLYLLEYKY
jgi:hypothetical protein